jgi:hypothetical protein
MGPDVLQARQTPELDIRQAQRLRVVGAAIPRPEEGTPPVSDGELATALWACADVYRLVLYSMCGRERRPTFAPKTF